jgi:hypothetical protein
MSDTANEETGNVQDATAPQKGNISAPQGTKVSTDSPSRAEITEMLRLATESGSPSYEEVIELLGPALATGSPSHEEVIEVLRVAATALEDPGCDSAALRMALHVHNQHTNGKPLSPEMYQNQLALERLAAKVRPELSPVDFWRCRGQILILLKLKLCAEYAGKMTKGKRVFPVQTSIRRDCNSCLSCIRAFCSRHWHRTQRHSVTGDRED